jgi:flagellar biosynthesis protein
MKKQKGYSAKKAAALSYQGEGAPVLIAKGEGLNADLMVEIGQQSEVPIVEGEALANYLQGVEVGEEVPEVLFESVAIVLSWAYWLRGKVPESR